MGIFAGVVLTILTVVAGAVILVSRLPDGPTDREVEQAMLNGNLIFDAVSKYKQDHAGDVPSELVQLVPIYLEAIPLPAKGEGPWSYSVDEDGSVYLGYDFGSWSPAIWSTGGQWVVDTK
jgi:hypothetical protein